MSLNQQVFTNAGVTMLGNANAGSLLTITKIVVGSGAAVSNADLYPLTALIGFKNNVTITRKTDLGGGKLIVSGALVEALMAPGAAYALRELGIMAKIGTGTEQLYTVSNVFADSPDTVTPGGTSTHAFDITVVIDRATNVAVTLGDPNTVDCVNIPDTPATGPGVYSNRLGNIFRFKRLVAGTGISMTETSDRITINKKVLDGINLYVPPSHPDNPGPDTGFNTLQLAFDYLNDYVFSPNAVIVINVDGGNHLSSATITCAHPQAQVIQVIGKAPIAKTISAIVHVDTTHKKVTVNNTTGLIVGQRVQLAGTFAGYSGGCKITAISGLDVTCSIEKRDSRPAFTTAQGAGGSLTYHPTVFQPNPNPLNPAMNFPNGIGRLQWATVDGNTASACLTGNGRIVIIQSNFWNAVRGLSVEGVVYLCSSSNVCQCDTGVFAERLLAVSANFGTFQGTGSLNINACNNAVLCRSAVLGSNAVGETYIAAFAHCINVLNVGLGADLNGSNILASTNNAFLNATNRSVAVLNNYGQVGNCDNNGTDLVASGMSYIHYYKNGGGTPLTSPPAGTLGNDNSLIKLEA